MSEHTPGPWTAEGGMVLDSRRNIVASRWSWRHADKDENALRSDEAIHPVEADANCRLIAAAPELLEALEVLLRQYRVVRPQIFGTDTYEEWARAALAKAKEGK